MSPHYTTGTGNATWHLLIVFLSALGFIDCIAGQNIFQAIERVYNAESHCCGDLGCFDVVGAFLDLLKRPINPLPSCENHIKFTLKTQDNINEPDILNPLDLHSINKSHFRSDRDGVKVLIHGYIDDGRAPWIAAMEPRLLLQGDYNVITADWSTGVSIPYFQAASNTRVVGAEVARLIRVLRTKFGQNYRKIHIIGHSLGAHVAGYAGKLERVGRVSGLDPAGIYFSGMPSAARLDAGDADFVDTIITDGRV
ncbi:hypothetical protein RvY_07268 [Ramazzottius varieornatus]|uniref:Lipase domain-containing protein n=1 Tax=Ramazzottius varieornatus TaxID=947166 RepID=A0A1D1V7N4_RAMVA|nr:hypothetical protein RvY_07268 [Ramazzottius varieornatus]